MKIVIDNQTHWQTADIKRIVKALCDAGRWPSPPKILEFHLKRSAFRPTCSMQTVNYPETLHLNIGLPMRGPKGLHSNPMTHVALSTSVPEGAEVLNFEAAFQMANMIAGNLLNFWVPSDPMHYQSISNNWKSLTAQPVWAPVETFLIRKYKDPMKDMSFREFVEEKEEKLRTLDVTIGSLRAAMTEIKTNLHKTEKLKKKIQRSLAAARQRRRSRNISDEGESSS